MIALYIYLSMLGFWTLYLAIMNLKRAKDARTLTKTAYYMALPLLGIGYLVDFLMNYTIFWLLFLEVPQEYLVSDRLSRHTHDKDGWRKRLACWFGANLLDVFDPSGKHLR